MWRGVVECLGSSGCSYIGTFQLEAGTLVFHVFEVTKLVRLLEDGRKDQEEA